MSLVLLVKNAPSPEFFKVYTWEVVEKTGVPATSPICLIPLMLAAFGEMSQILLVIGTPVFSTIVEKTGVPVTSTICTIENKTKLSFKPAYPQSHNYTSIYIHYRK